jgi:hypothetical protein
MEKIPNQKTLLKIPKKLVEWYSEEARNQVKEILEK